MPRQGFIRDELDVKMLVLYIISHAGAPMSFFKLIDLALCDSGVDYFSLAEAISHLVETGNLHRDGDDYSTTEKGNRNSQFCESSLPYSVRLKCDRNLAAWNAELRRAAQVKGEVQVLPDGRALSQLSLDDDTGNLLKLALVSADPARAEAICKTFRAHPEQIYNALLQLLLRSAPGAASPDAESEVLQRDDGTFAARLSLGPELPHRILLEFTAASEDHARQLCSSFQQSADLFYSAVIDIFLSGRAPQLPEG